MNVERLSSTPAVASLPTHTSQGVGGVMPPGVSQSEMFLLREINFLSANLINNPNCSPTRDQIKPQLDRIRKNLSSDSVTEKAVLDLMECAKSPRINDSKSQLEIIKACGIALDKLFSKKEPPGNHFTHIVSGPRPPDFHKIESAIHSIVLVHGGGEEEQSSYFSALKTMIGRNSEDRANRKVDEMKGKVQGKLRQVFERRFDQYNR